MNMQSSTVPWCFLYLLLLDFCLQIAYRKVNLQIGVNKLVGKVSINLLHHVKSAACIINIIIDTSTVAYVCP